MTMTTTTATTTGWIVFVASFGMMCGMLAVDIASLHEWSEMTTPVFVGTTLGHVAAVVTAFIGGKLIPADRESAHTRATDPKPPSQE